MCKKFTLEQVRTALVKSDILTEETCAAMSDDELRAARLIEDLGADSLSIILRLMHLERAFFSEEGKHLTILDDEEWEVKTIDDILMLKCR